jgi:predicted transposase YdaD
MTDYRLRLYRKYPERKVHQVVIYLSPSKSPLVNETTFNLGELIHNFNVIRLWEQPTEIFQQYQGLLPFAALSQTNTPEETLRQVARQIENITDQQLQSNVAASTAIISGIALSKEIIKRLLRSDIMKESVIYQEILHEGLAEGKAKGLAEGKAKGLVEGKAKGLAEGKAKGLAEGKAKGLAKGKAEERNQIALNMLSSNIAVDVIAQVTGLTVKQVQRLSAKKSQKPKN